MKISEPIVFFGSGPVAAKSLSLIAQTFDIEAVVTKPRLPHHRGEVPVLSLAEDLGLPIKTVTNKSELAAIFDSNTFKSRVGILIDFGIIVTKKSLDRFPLGIINSHFSVLPEWRGADPITFSILSGQSQTGVSLMLLVEKMDEGPLLAYSHYDIKPDTTAPRLTKDLIDISYALLKNILPMYLAGELEPVPQSTTGRKVSYSRKLNKNDGELDWSKPAVQLEHEVRAFIEWPKSRSAFGQLELVITEAHAINESGPAGKTTTINKQPAVFCGEGALVLDHLKPAGKKQMSGEAFLAGYRQTFLS